MKGKKTGGRQQGTPNKATKGVRQAIALLAERNVAQLECWLIRVAKRDPAKAADLLLKAIEYHIPKLARSEVTGKDGLPLEAPIVHVHFPETRSKR